MCKKSRKRWKMLTLVGACLCLVTYSCLNEEFLSGDGKKDNKTGKSKNQELTKEIAQQWYETNNTPVVSVITRGAVNSKGMSVKPKWENAKENRRRRYEVVETPLLTQRRSIFLDKETMEHWDEVKGKKYLRNTARMVVMKDTKTGNIRSFIMVFVGSLEYLKNTNSMGNNSYLYRNPDFDGKVLFFEPGGGLINGWKYENGKITEKISPAPEMEGELFNFQTRGEVCEYTYETVMYEECEEESYVDYDDEYGIGIGVSVTCNTYYDQIEHKSCYYVGDDNDDNNDDDNWEGDNPSGSVDPPSITDPQPGTPAYYEKQLQEKLPDLKNRLAKLGTTLNMPIRYSENCLTNARVVDGVIEVCQEFFLFDNGDQSYIIWHEIYHVLNDRELPHENKVTLDESYMLAPDNQGDVYINIYLEWYYDQIKDVDDYYIETFKEVDYSDFTKITELNPADWYRNEIDAYTAEREICDNPSTHYEALREYTLWYYEECLKLAERYNP